jgi:hypothetical protein
MLILPLTSLHSGIFEKPDQAITAGLHDGQWQIFLMKLAV